MASSAPIYNDKQGNIRVRHGAFDYNLILTRIDEEWGMPTACVWNFSKERLQEIVTKLQEFLNSN